MIVTSQKFLMTSDNFLPKSIFSRPLRGKFHLNDHLGRSSRSIATWPDPYQPPGGGRRQRQSSASALTEMIHLTRHSLNSTFCLFLNVQKIHLTRHSGKTLENRHFEEESCRKVGVFERKNPTHLTRHSLNSTKIGILRSDSLNSTSS